MEFGKLTGAVLVGVIMIVIVMVVVIPVLGSASYNILGNNTPDSYANEVPETAVITWTATGYTMNDEAITWDVSKILLVSDSIAIQRNVSALVVYNFDTPTDSGPTSTVTISSGAFSYTTGGNAKTGTISGTAYYLGSETGTMGVYNSESFSIDQTATLTGFNNITVRNGSDSINIRGVVTGTVDSLAYGGALTLTSGVYAATTGTATVAMNSNSVTEPNEKIYTVASKSTLNVSYVDDGTTYTGASDTAGATWVAPLQFTQVTASGGAIESLIGIAPLLMIVGVIIMIIGMAAFRN